MEASCSLADRRCVPCEGGVPPLTESEVRKLLSGPGLEGWALAGQRIERTFRFRNHYETIAFVNAVAWISHAENHHPELTVGYADCRIAYWTHAIDGLSENDFICAAKVNQLSGV